LPCRRHILPLLLETKTGPSVREELRLSCIRIAIALGTVAIVASGCAASSNTTSAQGEQPYKTLYGLTSEGTTTDLYTEIFGPRQPPPAPATAAAAQPTQPVTSQPIAPVQQAQAPTNAGRQTATTRQTQSAANRTQQPVQIQPAPVQVAQQPAPPPPPPEPDVPTVYGITANGPTTDLYTMIFGSKRDGQ
jgi:hypothetical protein